MAGRNLLAEPKGRNLLADAPKRREKADTPISGPLEALMSGLSFGWSDELAGLAGGIADWTKGKGFQGGYERRRKAAQQNLSNYAEDNPVAAPVLQVGGALAGMAPRAAGALTVEALPTLTGRIRQGATIGTGFGAVAGAGGAEEGIENRLSGAGVGATLGAGLGAALPVAAQGVSAGGRHLGNMLGLRDAQTVANEKLAAAIARDDTTPARLLAEIDAARSAGVKPEFLSDFAGENVRSVARSAAMTPGEGRNIAVQAIQNRQAGQAARVERDILSDLSGNARYPVEQAMQAQRRAAGPLYERAYAQHPAIMSEELQGILARPSTQQAMQRAYRIAQEEVRDPTGVLGMRLADDGTVQVTRAPSLQTWDYIKRGLDDEVARFRNAVTGRLEGEEGRAIDQTRRALLAALDEAAPGYRQARAAYAGPTRSAEVYREGRAALRDDADITAREVADLAPGEMTFFQVGVARALRDMAMRANDGANSVARVFGNPLLRERIRAAFPNDRAFFNFQAAMQREARMFENARTLNPTANSHTVLRQADLAAAAPSPLLEVGASIVRGEGPRAALMQALGADRAVNRLGGYTPEVSRRLSSTLFNPDYTTQQEALRGLLSMPLRQQPALNRGEAYRRGALTGLLGAYGGL